MLICSCCNKRMIKTSYEFYCPHCGLVESNYIKFDYFRKGVGKAVLPWKSNFNQTKKSSFWKNGREALIKLRHNF